METKKIERKEVWFCDGIADESVDVVIRRVLIYAVLKNYEDEPADFETIVDIILENAGQLHSLLGQYLEIQKQGNENGNR